MDDLHAHLKELEERLFDPAVRGSRQALAELLCPELREIGSSGRLFDLEDILTSLPTDPEDIALRTLEGFDARLLSDGIALVTYQAARASSRQVHDPIAQKLDLAAGGGRQVADALSSSGNADAISSIHDTTDLHTL
jgi:hypothetical protein